MHRDDEIEKELRFHVDERVAELVTDGVPADEARRRAQMEMGGVTQAREATRERAGWLWLAWLAQDFRYGARLLMSNPGFTAVVIATLGLGIGASVGIFSVVYGVLIRPLPYRDAERLVAIGATQQLDGAPRPLPAAFQAATLQSTEGTWRSFERFVYSSTGTAALARPQGAEMIDTGVVSSGFMTSLGASAVLGRPLAADDDLRPVVVISERLWARLFNRSPSAVGQSLTLQSVPYTVVGVVEKTFQLPEPKTDVWIPLGFLLPRGGPRGYSLRPIATMKAGVSFEAARAEVAAWARTLSVDRQYVNHRVVVKRLADDISGNARRPLLILLAAVGLLLIVACANVANLLLARGASRAREWEVRAALGASNRRIISQRVAEVALLAAGGTVAGLLIAQVIAALLPSVASGIPRLDGVGINAVALAFAVGLAVLVTIVTGTLSALRRTGWRHSATSTEAPAARRLRKVLCAVEIAVALLLLVGASLLGRTLTHLLGADLGATTNHVTSASLFFPGGVRQPDARVIDIARRIEDRLRAVPGVQDVGLGTSLPIGGSRIRITLLDEPRNFAAMATGVPATPGYFRALGMRLVEGRFFTDADDDQHPQVGILTEETARRYFPDGSALGRTLSLPRLRAGMSAGQVDVTIVGIVKNVKYSTVDAAPEDAMYRPFAQQAWGSPFLVVRTTIDPAASATTLRKEVAAVDPEIVVSLVRPLDEVVRASIAGPRFRAFVFGWLAFVAVALAGVGLSGAIGYSVTKRTAEIGVRMALGAVRRDVLQLVFKETAWIVAAGVAAGLTLAFAATRLLTALLYEVAPTDPWSFGASVLGLALLAFVAAYLPARRAARIDPMVALRCD
jgi:putative ABC transport system permease protein